MLECRERPWFPHSRQGLLVTCCHHVADEWQLEERATFILPELPAFLLHWSPEQPRNPQKALWGPRFFLPCSQTPMGITADLQRHPQEIRQMDQFPVWFAQSSLCPSQPDQVLCEGRDCASPAPRRQVLGTQVILN